MQVVTPHTETVANLNHLLWERLGPQGWWPTTPAEGVPPVYHPTGRNGPISDAEAYEILVGAILTQNTSWSGAKQAICNLTGENRLDPERIAGMDGTLEAAIRPARYFNQKARRLREISAALTGVGGIPVMRGMTTADLRSLLLSWSGIGPETADCVLCYAFDRPVFVVDAYTRRLFARLGLPHGSYREMQRLVHGALVPSATAYGEFHARIVRVLADGLLEEIAATFAARATAYERWRKAVLKGFQQIPGVGPKIAEDLWRLGYRATGQLADQIPKAIYDRLCALQKHAVDRCMLYVFRCAVYYAAHPHPDPERLKWWWWADRNRSDRQRDPA